ncbi:primosomal protein DnaI [Salinibacillus xinjiangensis]|uniref:Primosomal protein DnaI n=1 Tax=Salinibacillus xinjiangensis TaxID=1229268 RepID=A0A6G1X9H6_9BACI|nr:primosomal protein DnaI [Salinibacillus xinjiangensis]MRG87663.1 primosomal protein DnaI [Salinibacillus xinjiangensis]
MEPLQSALKKWLKNSESFQEAFVKMKNEILQTPNIKNFLQDNPQLKTEDIDRQLIKLYEYETQSKACEKCASLDECCNMVKGYVPKMSATNGQINLTYDKCPRKLQHDEQERKKSFVQSLYMPKRLLEARFDQVELDDPERFQAIRKIERYLHESEDKPASKGLYLYGPFGVGKSYLLGALANTLAEREIRSLFIYMPEFVREIKSSINDSTINQKIDRFKRAPVLILDDIGSEYQSAWFRDEVLGAILQYRMMEQLPVFFTSNYSLEELEVVLSSSNKGDSEKLKARRLIERIKQVSEPVAMLGENRRK